MLQTTHYTWSLGYGWEPIGVPMLVTRAQGTQVIELDGRPAAQVYEEQLNLGPGELTPEKFWNTSILHPFGLLQFDRFNCYSGGTLEKRTGDT